MMAESKGKIRRARAAAALQGMQPPTQPEVLEREGRSAIGFAIRFEELAAKRLAQAVAEDGCKAAHQMLADSEGAKFAGATLRAWALELLDEARVKRTERGW